MKIFLAAPFTNLIDAETSTTESGFTQAMQKLLSALRSAGHNVISAHEREGWGIELDPPAEALRYDLDGVRNSDILFALIGDPPSPGVQLEIGVAIEAKKRMVCAVRDGEFVPYLLRGIDSLSHAQLVHYRDMDHLTEILLGIAAGP